MRKDLSADPLQDPSISAELLFMRPSSMEDNCMLTRRSLYHGHCMPRPSPWSLYPLSVKQDTFLKMDLCTDKESIAAAIAMATCNRSQAVCCRSWRRPSGLCELTKIDGTFHVQVCVSSTESVPKKVCCSGIPPPNTSR